MKWYDIHMPWENARRWLRKRTDESKVVWLARVTTTFIRDTGMVDCTCEHWHSATSVSKFGSRFLQISLPVLITSDPLTLSGSPVVIPILTALNKHRWLNGRYVPLSYEMFQQNMCCMVRLCAASRDSFLGRRRRTGESWRIRGYLLALSLLVRENHSISSTEWSKLYRNMLHGPRFLCFCCCRIELD